MLAKAAKKKEPVTREMLAQLKGETNRNSSLANIRLATAWLLVFAGFLHFDEFVHLQQCDIEITATMMKLCVLKSKTGQKQKQ